MSCSYSLTTFALVLILTVGKIEATCAVLELITLNKCALPYMGSFSMAWRSGTCNHTIIAKELCDEFELFVNCFNNADVSPSTCRPYAIQLLNLQFEYSCQVSDFVSQCTCAPQMNHGSGANSLLHGHDELMGILLSPVVPVLAAWLASV